MPSWILPSDMNNVGALGHTTDHNHIVDDLTLISDAMPVVSGAAGQVFPGWLAPTVVNLTFVASGTTTVNTTLGNAFNLTLTASTTTLGNPANPVEGQVIRFRITQGGGGGFTLNYAGAYDFGNAGAPGLSTTAGAVDILGFEYVASISSWAYLGSALGNLPNS